MKEGEQVVHSWEGIYNEPHVTHEAQKRMLHRDRVVEKETTQHEGGVLVLTNKRLIWVEKRGPIGKSYHTAFEIYLTTLQGISVGGTVFKYVTITDNVQQYGFNLKGIGTKEIEPFRDMIMRQKEKIGTQGPAVTREVITKEVVMIPCGYCKALMPQTWVFCPICGARRA